MLEPTWIARHADVGPYTYVPSLHSAYIKTTQHLHHLLTRSSLIISQLSTFKDMVSLQALFSPNSSQEPNEEFDSNNNYVLKKRKLEEIAKGDDDQVTAFDHKRSSKSPVSDIELQLETPLPLEWERCLDIQSGEIHFYNTRTQKKTTGDPRGSPEQPSYSRGGGHMSLELQLNLLPCDSSEIKIQETTAHNDIMIMGKPNNSSASSSPPRHHHHHHHLGDDCKKKSSPSSISSGGDHHHQSLYPSWLAFDQGGDDDEDVQQEMVATACMRCHMLVMLCKSSPTCPNCKFLHPPDQSPPKSFKQRLSLLC